MSLLLSFANVDFGSAGLTFSGPTLLGARRDGVKGPFGAVCQASLAGPDRNEGFHDFANLGRLSIVLRQVLGPAGGFGLKPVLGLDCVERQEKLYTHHQRSL